MARECSFALYLRSQLGAIASGARRNDIEEQLRNVARRMTLEEIDIVRDLKRVNAHLAAAAYPILEGRGELLPSRLRQDI